MKEVSAEKGHICRLTFLMVTTLFLGPITQPLIMR